MLIYTFGYTLTKVFTIVFAFGKFIILVFLYKNYTMYSDPSLSLNKDTDRCYFQMVAAFVAVLCVMQTPQGEPHNVKPYNLCCNLNSVFMKEELVTGKEI